MEVYGVCHSGRDGTPDAGDWARSNWAEIIHALLRAGYDSDLNIEGWHDPVFRDHNQAPPADIKPHWRPGPSGPAKDSKKPAC